jgi:hypothetical protein
LEKKFLRRIFGPSIKEQGYGENYIMRVFKVFTPLQTFLGK